jgi:hypothetical protein
VATLTAQDIARHIKRPEEPLSAAVARLRNWTATGIIKAEGEKNPGTGHKRRYQVEALLEAVILQALIDAFGSPAASLASVIGDLSEAVFKAARRPKNIVFVLSRRHGADHLEINAGALETLGEYISKSDLDVHTVINVKRLYERLPRDWLDAVRETETRAEKGRIVRHESRRTGGR